MVNKYDLCESTMHIEAYTNVKKYIVRAIDQYNYLLLYLDQFYLKN